MASNYKCPICGFSELHEPPYDDDDCPSFEICPCCGSEFGYDDAAPSLEKRSQKWYVLREKWVSEGMSWYSDNRMPPEDWNPTLQVVSLE